MREIIKIRKWKMRLLIQIMDVWSYKGRLYHLLELRCGHTVVLERSERVNYREFITKTRCYECGKLY